MYNWTPQEFFLDINQLLSRRGTVNLRGDQPPRCSEDSVNSDLNKMTSPIVEAVQRGNAEEVRKLVNVDNVNRSYHRLPLLHRAVMNGRSEVVKLLLESGADVNSPCSIFQKTPLHWAVQKGNIEIMEILLGHKADVNSMDQDDRTPLFSAVRAPELMEILIQNGAVVNHADYCHDTPLHCAAGEGRVEVVETLIRNGADVNCVNEDGATPLHWATLAEERRVETMEILVRNKAEIKSEHLLRRTPLHLVAGEESVDALEILLSAGADVNSEDAFDLTPLHMASQSHHLEAATELLRYGAKVNLQDYRGATPLHLAFENPDVMIVLLEYGANPETRCNDRLPTLIDWLNKEQCINCIEGYFLKIDALRCSVEGLTRSPPHNSHWDQQRRNQFLHKCLKELELLNVNISNTDITYRDILEQKPAALKDLEVERILSHDNHLNRFPIYGDLIDIRFGFAHHQRLLLSAVAILFGKGDFSVLPEELIGMICGYLAVRDLRRIALLTSHKCG